MSEQHSKATILSMAVIASASATLLHEGIGHGVTAWLRGDIPTELTSNHLSCGSNHFTFTDDGAIFKSRIMRGILRLFGKLKIDARRQLAITAFCIDSFFDAYLKRGTPLHLEPSRYPEVELFR